MRDLLNELSVDELVEWEGWFLLKSQKEEEARKQIEQERALAESVNGGVDRASSWR